MHAELFTQKDSSRRYLLVWCTSFYLLVRPLISLSKSESIFCVLLNISYSFSDFYLACNAEI